MRAGNAGSAATIRAGFDGNSWMAQMATFVAPVVALVLSALSLRMNDTLSICNRDVVATDKLRSRYRRLNRF